MKSLPELLKQRLARPVAKFLKQGLSPEKLALTFAIGTALSISPLVGTTTITCTLAALIFRLNLGAIQAVNYAAFPLQLILLVPFIELGVWVFGADALPFTQGEIATMAETDPLGIIERLWDYLAMGLAVWAVALIPISIGIYYLSLPLFRQIQERRLRKQEKEEQLEGVS